MKHLDDVPRTLPADRQHDLCRHRARWQHRRRNLQRVRPERGHGVDQGTEQRTQHLFHGQPDGSGQRKKPKKEDITEITAVWADIDPLDGNGRPWAEERERLEALADELHALPTPPTFIVD